MYNQVDTLIEPPIVQLVPMSTYCPPELDVVMVPESSFNPLPITPGTQLEPPAFTAVPSRPLPEESFTVVPLVSSNLYHRTRSFARVAGAW